MKATTRMGMALPLLTVSVIVWHEFDSNHPPTCDQNSGQPLPPIANDRSIVVKIADLDQKIAKK
jgi:hypothetical protein